MSYRICKECNSYMHYHPPYDMSYPYLKCPSCGFTKESKPMLKEVTIEEYLMGRDKDNPLTDEMKKDAQETIKRVNLLLKAFKSYRSVTSGYRPAAINAAIGGAKKSNHMICRACDLEDKDGELDKFCSSNTNVLKEIGLWLESPNNTIGWCHVQIVPPKSGNIIFIP